MRFQKTLCLALSLAALIAASPSPFAQGKQDEIVMVPETMSVELVRNTENKASLRVTAPIVTDSCVAIKPLEYKRQYTQLYMDIAFAGYKMSPSGSPGNCAKGMQYPRVDIPIIETFLRERNISAIRLILSGDSRTDIYNVDITGRAVTITPRTQTTFRIAKPRRGSVAATTVVTYPDNTVILTAPAIPEQSRKAEIRNYALSRGFVPLETKLPGFTPPESGQGAGHEDRYYYVDEQAQFIETLKNKGQISLTNMIYARIPGAYE